MPKFDPDGSHLGDPPKMGSPLDQADPEFKSATANTLAVVRWVSEHMGDEEIKVCICPAAWEMLKWCRESPINRSKFYETIFPKLLPSKGALDAEERTHDDGRGQLGLIDRVLDEHEAYVATLEETGNV